jgi:hypothetical protein
VEMPGLAALRLGTGNTLRRVLLDSSMCLFLVSWPGACAGKASFCPRGWCLQHAEPGSARGDLCRRCATAPASRILNPQLRYSCSLAGASLKLASPQLNTSDAPACARPRGANE